MNKKSQIALEEYLGKYILYDKENKPIKEFELYYDTGLGSKSFFCLRWGRVHAKKKQQEIVNFDFAYKILCRKKKEGYVLIKGNYEKMWNLVQQKEIAHELNDIISEKDRSNKVDLTRRI